MFTYKGSLIVKYELKALTGLRVGGSKENFEIGGVDNPVIKTLSVIEKYDGENDLPEGAPYIPGSSLKGKMRSLLEWAKDRVGYMIEKAMNPVKKEEDENPAGKENNKNPVEEAGEPCNCGACEVCIVFGTGKLERDERAEFEKRSIDKIPGPPRLRVFDAYPTWKTLEQLKEALGENIFTEIKTENAINRLTSRANPRKVERIPAGVTFFGDMTFHLFRGGDEDLFKILLQGMVMLEDDYLGGYGSRGSGKVKFENLKIIFRPKEYYSKGQGEELLGQYKTTKELLSQYDSIKQKLKSYRNA